MQNDFFASEFTELSMEEALLISGGSVFSDVLGIISTAFTSITGLVPVLGGIVNAPAQAILRTIQSIAAPIYAMSGLEFGSL
jgi:hypothetical protein